MLPDKYREILLRVGYVDCCALTGGDPEKLGQVFQRMIENTHATHGLEPVRDCHFVATPEGLSIAMVGTSPTSDLIAQIIAAAWNTMVEAASAEVHD